MRDIPVILSGYKLTVVDSPAPKMKDNDNGGKVAVVDRQGVTQFVVSLFAKRQVPPGERAPKGEEIKVTLTTDPGDGFPEDSRVELIDPSVTAYEMKTDDGRIHSGISFKAMGLKPVHAPRPAPTPSGDK